MGSLKPADTLFHVWREIHWGALWMLCRGQVMPLAVTACECLCCQQRISGGPEILNCFCVQVLPSRTNHYNICVVSQIGGGAQWRSSSERWQVCCTIYAWHVLVSDCIPEGFHFMIWISLFELLFLDSDFPSSNRWTFIWSFGLPIIYVKASILAVSAQLLDPRLRVRWGSLDPCFLIVFGWFKYCQFAHSHTRMQFMYQHNTKHSSSTRSSLCSCSLVTICTYFWQ